MLKEKGSLKAGSRELRARSAERRAQGKTRETLPLRGFQNLLRPLPCASGPDLSLQAGSSLKLPTGQFPNGRPFNRKEVYWQR